MKPFKTYLACAALLFAMALPNLSQADVRVGLRVSVAPPAPKVVVVKPKPHRADGVWVAGHWNWDGKKYLWIEGRYVDPKPGFVWIDGHWAHDRHGWYWVDGHWKRVN